LNLVIVVRRAFNCALDDIHQVISASNPSLGSWITPFISNNSNFVGSFIIFGQSTFLPTRGPAGILCVCRQTKRKFLAKMAKIAEKTQRQQHE